jgi:hypothetical protein
VTSEAPPKSSAELRVEVEEARARLATTVGELGGAIDETKTRIVARIKQVAPIAGGIAGTYVLVKLVRHFRGGDDEDDE